MPAKKKKAQIAAYTHPGDTRPNIPTAEVEPVMGAGKKKPITLEYERTFRNTDLDPQLVWKGKDEQDQEDLVVTAPPIFIQEKVHPRVLIEDLMRQSSKERNQEEQLDLFADFNGLDDPELKGDYYEHEQNWSNRMILGDNLQVMASLASREGYQGKVQCIYIDPPYGIRFNSNFQWSTTSRDVKDGNSAHITREPEQVKAFRDTWREGIHSYLTYLRDRLTVARDLLSDSGSIFVQIGDENVHRVRAVMDEIFGDENFLSLISFRKTGSTSATLLDANNDYLIWYGRDAKATKYRALHRPKTIGGEGATEYRSVKLTDSSERQATEEELRNLVPLPKGGKLFALTSVVSDGAASNLQPITVFGETYRPGSNEHWKTTIDGMYRLAKADRLSPTTKKRMYRRYFDDFPIYSTNNNWQDVRVRYSPNRQL